MSRNLKTEIWKLIFNFQSPLRVRDWSGILLKRSGKDIAESPTAKPERPEKETLNLRISETRYFLGFWIYCILKSSSVSCWLCFFMILNNLPPLKMWKKLKKMFAFLELNYKLCRTQMKGNSMDKKIHILLRTNLLNKVSVRFELLFICRDFFIQ